MNHPRRLLRAVLDGAACGPAEDRALREHLRGCARCRAEYDARARLLRAARGSLDGPAPGELERLRRRAVALAARAPQAAPRATWRLAAAIAAGLAALLIVAVALTRPAVVGRVLVAGPGLEIAGRPVAAGQAIHQGEVVAARGGDSALLLDGERGVLLRRGGTISFDSAESAKLLLGRARFAVKKGRGPFSVAAGEVQVDVVGTIFAVERRTSGDTLVAVHRGEVRVRAPRGEARLREGQECVVAQGAPGPVRPASAGALEEDRGDWFSELLRRLAGLRDAIQRAIGEER